MARRPGGFTAVSQGEHEYPDQEPAPTPSPTVEPAPTSPTDPAGGGGGEPAPAAQPAEPGDTGGGTAAGRRQRLAKEAADAKARAAAQQAAQPGQRPGTRTSQEALAARAGVRLGAFDPRLRPQDDQARAIASMLGGQPTGSVAALSTAQPPSLGFNPSQFSDEQRILGALR